MKMSDIRKRVIAILAVACMALTAATGCSSKNKDNPSSSSGTGAEVFDDSFETIKNDDNNVVGYPFQIGKSGDNGLGLVAPDGVDLNADDPVAETVKPTGAGTSTDVEAPTEVVEVTDAAGEPVTDAEGEPVTEIVTVPSSGGNSSSGGNVGSGNETTNVSADDYVSNTDAMYCLWMDIDKNVNFVFNDQVFKVTFKLKDNIPNRDYPVRINPDLSSVAGQTVHADSILQGTIRVGSDIEAQDASSMSGFVISCDKISANAGDTVDYYISMKDNPGLAAVLMWVYYDKNAMEIENIVPAGEFANIATKRTQQVGTSAIEE